MTARGQRGVDHEEVCARARKTRAFKAAHRDGGTGHCAVCKWCPPTVPPRHRNSASSRRLMALHMHHVIPRHKGGDDSDENLILLCPNHHAIAHAIDHIWLGHGGGTYVTRRKLIAALRLGDARPDDWLDIFDEKTGEHSQLRKGRKRRLRPDGTPRRKYDTTKRGKALLVPKVHPLDGVGF